MDKLGLYTVELYDKQDQIVGRAENVLAWSRREASHTMMNRLPGYTTWNAWRTEELEHWPADDPGPEYKIEFAAARLLALGRIRITEPPSDETVRRWCRQGRFPNAHKKQDTRGQGGSWRIPEADLLRFVKPVRGPKGPRIRKGDSDV